jgi:hypothetical protein
LINFLKNILSMRHFYVLTFSLCLIAGLYAQNDCSESDFLTPISGLLKDTTIQYGQNVGYLNNNTVNLSMDVYWVDGDQPGPRPLVILAHGGGFVFGSREDMRARCEAYAQLGYVCSSISYRLYPWLLALTIDSATVVDVSINAINDLRGAIRWFKADADQLNTFQVDPNKIIIGGYSAGAIMALQAGMLQETDEVSDELRLLVDGKGGLEGNTGDTVNLSYTSDVNAVINLSGAMFQRDWVSADDPVLTSIHGLNDTTVPHDFRREGAFNRVTVYGSTELHEQADEVGLPNFYVSIPGGGHSNIYSSAQFSEDLSVFEQNTLVVMKGVACNTVTTSIGSLEIPQVHFDVFPNPSNGVFTIQAPEGARRTVSLYNTGGRMIEHRLFFDEKITIEKTGLPSGWYVLHIFNEGIIEAAKVIIIE